RVDIVHSPRIGAGSHGDYPFRLKHLLIESLDDRCHLDERRAGNHHEVSLAWRSANDFGTEAGNVVGGGKGGGHFHITAGKAEVVWPKGVFAPPVHCVV